MGFGAMYVGITGMIAQGTNMDVIGNNLANVDTVGFKFAKTQFSDLMSSDYAGGSHQPDTNGTAGVYNQIGMGVAVADVRADYRQGGFEVGTTNTDLAISGKGFFKVKSPTTGDDYYTRAGNFRFDKDGNLTMGGNILQGGAVDPLTGASSGSGNIKLPLKPVVFDAGTTAQRTQNTVVCDPKATTTLKLSMNLDSSEADQATNASNPFFSLLSTYNGKSSKPLTAYAGNESVNIYDASGNAHTLTLYFDPVATSNAGGQKYWEYVLAMDPSEDGSALRGTSGAGLLMAGTMTFSASGDLINQSAYVLSSASSDPKNLASWIPTTFSKDLPVFSAAFGTSGASATAQMVSLDFGLSNAGSWNISSGSAASVGTDFNSLARMTQPSLQAGATTNYAAGTALLSSSQDGFAAGYLADITVDENGFVNASFTNGETQSLYQVKLYCFNNAFGLRRDGGNMYLATTESGEAQEGNPQDAGATKAFGFGGIKQDSLEASNVDMADQFVQMILTQRGLQANTKVVTTMDAILGRLIDLKR